MPTLYSAEPALNVAVEHGDPILVRDWQNLDCVQYDLHPLQGLSRIALITLIPRAEGTERYLALSIAKAKNSSPTPFRSFVTAAMHAAGLEGSFVRLSNTLHEAEMSFDVALAGPDVTTPEGLLLAHKDRVEGLPLVEMNFRRVVRAFGLLQARTIT